MGSFSSMKYLYRIAGLGKGNFTVPSQKCNRDKEQFCEIEEDRKAKRVWVTNIRGAGHITLSYDTRKACCLG